MTSHFWGLMPLDRKSENPQSDTLAARKRVTFEQAEGAEPLPSQLQLKELSPALRSALWAVVLRHIDDASRSTSFGWYVDDPWNAILKDNHVYRLHRMADDFESDTKIVRAQLRKIFEFGDYVAVFGFLQYVIRHSKCPYHFAEEIERPLRFGHAAYRVMDKTIVPIGSETEKLAIERAFADLATTELHGARRHLQNAAEQLTTGNNSDSIRESIHAVESVVRSLEPKGDFAKALAMLDAKVGIHGAMKAGFGNLYGFTSDEKGIRHPLLDRAAAKADETDALFMVGACAAFVSYLVNKSRAAGLLR